MISREQLDRIDRARIGVLGYVTSAGRPNALAVTPYVVEGRLVVTSTLALVEKAAAIRADGRVTLTAGGVGITGTATVQVDRSPAFFDAHLRRQELAKYPPARSLLGLPLHRRLLGWYVGRVAIWIEPEVVDLHDAGDRTTVTVLDGDGRLRTWIAPDLADPADPAVDRIELPAQVPDGAALLLVHDEDDAMRDLRQLALGGTVHGGVLEVQRRRGSLEPSSAGRFAGTLAELRRLRQLGRRARANGPLLAGWPPITVRTVDPA